MLCLKVGQSSLAVRFLRNELEKGQKSPGREDSCWLIKCKLFFRHSATTSSMSGKWFRGTWMKMLSFKSEPFWKACEAGRPALVFLTMASWKENEGKAHPSNAEEFVIGSIWPALLSQGRSTTLKQGLGYAPTCCKSCAREKKEDKKKTKLVWVGLVAWLALSCIDIVVTLSSCCDYLVILTPAPSYLLIEICFPIDGTCLFLLPAFKLRCRRIWNIGAGVKGWSATAFQIWNLLSPPPLFSDLAKSPIATSPLLQTKNWDKYIS